MWKPIKDFPNYEVSDSGEFRNVITGRILKFKPNERGYLYTNLSKNSKYKTHKVHRVVAETFIPNPENKPQVNHIDGDKMNNAVRNLEWVTQSENIRHMIKLGLSPQAVRVVQYSLEGNYIQTFDSLTQAATAVRGNTDSIRKTCEGLQRQHKQYVWRFKDVN